MANCVLICLALATIQFGFGFYAVIFSKYGKDNNVDPLVFCLLRDACAVPVLSLAAFVAEGKLMVLNFREVGIFALFGLFGLCAGQLLYLLGIIYTNAAVASMFQPIVPVWSYLLAIIFRSEKFPKLNDKLGCTKIIGVFIATSGAILASIGKVSTAIKTNSKKNSSYIFGYLFLLGNTLAAALMIVLQRKFIFQNCSSRWRNYPIGSTAWIYFFGFISTAISSLYYINKPEKFQTITKETLFPLIYAVFVTSALCYMLISWCNKAINSTLVTASWPLQVFISVIMAYFILDEVLNIKEIAGGLMITLGMCLVLLASYKENIKKMPSNENILDPLLQE